MIQPLHKDNSKRWGVMLAITQLMFIALGLVIEQPFIMMLPTLLVAGVIIVSRISWVYLLFALVIPFSVEVELPGGLGTDLPSEPVMWLLTGIAILFFVLRPLVIADVRWKHPISLLIVAHVLWIGFTAMLSMDVVISTKFFLAKIWYVVPFYFLFALIHSDHKTLERFFNFLISATIIAIAVVMIRHAGQGFSFQDINEAVHPIFRNHVNYACMLVALIPYVLAMFRIKKSWVWGLALLFFTIAIYLSFTRAAMLALFIGIGGYLIIKWKFSRLAILITIFTISVSIPYLMVNNKYLDYAPEYEKAIAHYRFDNLIEATYKFEDISTMERLYRWVAGKEMIMEKPLFGFGPGTFYSFYQDYSIAEFQTYVSNNPEKSGIHNYYLMTFVEQGFPGFIIIALLIIASIMYGEKAYHRLTDPKDRLLVMASTVSLIMMASILIINDLVEADKVGPFLFIGMAMIMNYHIKSSASPGKT